MQYTTKQLAQLAGVSARTLRYYDEIGLLKPSRNQESGYRVYGAADVERLQQILFYKTLGVELDEIIRILSDVSYDPLASLKSHRENLLTKKSQIDQLLRNVERSISEKEGKVKMKDAERFEGFIEQLVEENEAKYGEEIRDKYGVEAVDRSNKAFKNMSETTYNHMNALTVRILQGLDDAFDRVYPDSEAGLKIAEMHKEWLTIAWGYYNGEAHGGLVQMYVEDERFRAHYDVNGPGRAKFLRDAVLGMLKKT